MCGLTDRIICWSDFIVFSEFKCKKWIFQGRDPYRVVTKSRHIRTDADTGLLYFFDSRTSVYRADF